MAASGKRSVTITYKHPGAQPPVYIAGSFTTPAWEPQELQAVPVPEGDSTSHIVPGRSEYLFSRQFEIAVGDWQYKFRLGDGDWWVCDDTADITTDNGGNQNNILVVKPQSKILAHEDKQYHFRPHTGYRDSDHAWGSTGSSRTHSEPTEDRTNQSGTQSHKKRCNLIGHHNSNCSAHSASIASACLCNPLSTPSDGISSKEKLPAIKLPHSSIRTKGEARQDDLEKDILIDERSDPAGSKADTSDMDGVAKTGKGNISAADAEKVKQLISIPGLATVANGTAIDGPTADLEPNGLETPDALTVTQPASHDPSPLLSHERLTPEDPSEIHRARRTSIISRPEEGRNVSHEYPQLEVFPSGTGQILKRIATTRSQLDADETTDENMSAEQPFPTTELMHSPTFSHERCPAEQSALYRVRTPPPDPLPPSLSPIMSHERKHPDMDVISEQEDTESFDEDGLAVKASHEGTRNGDVNQAHESAGFDGSSDLRPIREENGVDRLSPTKTSISRC